MLLKNEIQAIAHEVVKQIGLAEDKLLTLEQASMMLGKTPQSIRRQCQRKQLPYHSHYGTLYFSSAELKKHLLQ